MIYTIGYGGMSHLEGLLNIMDAKKVEVLVDIRSNPRAWIETFAGRNLEKKLGQRYEFAGDRLGGKGDIAEADIAELAERHKGQTLMLMCAEKDPARCHRHYEIARRLLGYGVVAVHLVNLDEYPATEVPVKEGGTTWLKPKK